MTRYSPASLIKLIDNAARDGFDYEIIAKKANIGVNTLWRIRKGMRDYFDTPNRIALAIENLRKERKEKLKSGGNQE